MQIPSLTAYDYLLDYLVEKASPEEILAFELPQVLKERAQALMAKDQHNLTSEESRELSQLLETEALVAALRGRALEALNIRAKFKQGWKEAMQDETSPLSELWNDIDAE